MRSSGDSGIETKWRPSTVVLWLGLSVAVFVTATFALMSWQQHHTVVSEHQSDNDRLADSLEQHADGAFRLAAFALGAVAERAALQPDLARFDPGFDQFLAALKAKAPILAGLRVVDARGRFVHSYPDKPAENTLVADRDYFLAQRDGRSGIFVGKPALSRVSGEWVVPVSLRRQAPDGSFAGVVVAVLNLRDFADLYESVRTKPKGSASLFRADAVMLARAPTSLDMLGRSYATGPLFIEHLPKAPRGSFSQVALTDGTLRQVSYRLLPEFGVVIAVSNSYDDLLDNWRRYSTTLLAVGVPVVLLVLWITLRLHAELKTREGIERLLAQRSADLEMANDELRQVTQLTAHHLQEPLRTVLSYAQLLVRRHQIPGDEDSAEYIGFIRQGIDRMKSQLTALQRYLAMEQQMPAERGAVPLDEVLDEAVGRLAAVLAAAGAELERGQLPVVQGNRRQLTSLFSHLIENSLRYRHPSQPPRLRLEAEREGPMWLLRLSDNGVGLDNPSAEAIFNLLPPGQEDGGGSVLGLALCRKIVHLHGGRMWVEADLSGGTRLHFTLPAAPES